MYASNSDSNLSIDHAQARRHLELLGYQKGDKIFMRYIHPDPAHTPKSIKKSRLNWQECDRYQSEGYDAYFVVNGQGNTDAKVSVGRAIFYEHDDLDKSIQRDLWQSLGMPEPTFQVDTGGKSIHSYWVFDEPVPIADWRQLQEDLLEFSAGDRTIKNPSRIMRLAGSLYMKGENPGQNHAHIISESENRYSYQDLRGCIPARDTTIHEKPSLDLNGDVSLIACLTKDDRGLIDSGVSEGGRNASGAKLARNLIGTKSRLSYLGYRCQDDSRQLFDEYCARCTPSIPEREREQIWRKAEKDNPSASLTDEVLHNCAKAYLWNQQKGGKRDRKSSGSGSGSGNGGGSNVIPFPALTPLELVKKVLADTKSKAERNSAFIASGHNPRDLWAIATDLEKEEDNADEQIEAFEALPRLLKRDRLNLYDYLWGDGGRLAQAMHQTAEAMPTSPSFLLTTLIPVGASQIGTSSRVIIKASAKYKQPCIFWSGIVAKTGGLKSPSQNPILDPLVRLEIESKEQYESDLENYQIDHARWKKDKDADPADEPKEPVRKRYLTKDTTLETLERLHGQNPRGLLIHRDELAGDFKSENAYKNGKGADRESKLDQWNGSPIIVDRKEREITIERSAISRTGTIQWEILQGLMGDHDDPAGMFARWLFDCAEAPPRYISFDDEQDTGIDELLTNLYKQLGKMPQADYLLSPEAKPLFQEWQHYLVDRERKESHAGLRAVFPKIEAYTARFALWLHVVNAALANDLPQPTISGATMQRAIALAQYYLSQWELIMATNSPQSGLTGILLKIYQYLKDKDAITISKLKAGIRSLRKTDTAEIQAHCKWLADNGYVIVNGKKVQVIEKIDTVDKVDKKLTGVSTAVTPNIQGLRAKVDKVDKVDAPETPPQNIGDSSSKMNNPPLEPVNFVKASTEGTETSTSGEVYAVDKKVDTPVKSVNFSENVPQDAIAPDPTIAPDKKTSGENAIAATAEISQGEKTSSLDKSSNLDDLDTEDELDEQWLSEENLLSMASDLEDCKSKETLEELRKLYPRRALSEAAKLLPQEKRESIKRWVHELNHQLKVGDTLFYSGDDNQ